MFFSVIYKVQEKKQMTNCHIVPVYKKVEQCKTKISSVSRGWFTC